ncbi:MAG: hypothetical protein ABR860_13735 [Terracidiphilus sp.]
MRARPLRRGRVVEGEALAEQAVVEEQVVVEQGVVKPVQAVVAPE